jgi:biotin transporter BioY
MKQSKKAFLKTVGPYLLLAYLAFTVWLIYRIDVPEAAAFIAAGLFFASGGFVVIFLLILLNRKVKK